MEYTLAIIKPDCVKKNNIGNIIHKIEMAKFDILAIKKINLDKTSAKKFYAVHKDRPFFNNLVEFMTSGPCVAVALQKDNAVADFRKLIGATDPSEAEPGTIRAEFAESKQNNCVHGSDSVENGRIEVAFFFSEIELNN